ncbi:MAG: methionyl-tRNA formyltransferase [Planctomycetota bacterium]|nr:MAG: methionyl-tRNA formyltransferase [Planctomycetota bacterium]
MRIAFFGSDAFAVPSLEALAAAGHEVALVVTNPDRPRGRSGTPRPTPVKEVALRLGAPVLQPEGRPRRATREAVERSDADLGVVVAYGQYLGKRLREAPRLGYSINLHASLLPRWRGAAPVAAALLAGDPVTGVSVQKVDRRMDAGDVLARREVPVAPEDTRGSLRARLATEGAALLVEAVEAIARGEARFEAQDEAQATHAPLLRKEDGRLDLARGARELDRRVRATTPWPGAFLELPRGRLKVLSARPLDGGRAGADPGTVLGLAEEGLLVATGEGVLELLEVQPPGKRPMSGRAYANGRRLAAGVPLA